jgi:hypothetical protein
VKNPSRRQLEARHPFWAKPLISRTFRDVAARCFSRFIKRCLHWLKLIQNVNAIFLLLDHAIYGVRQFGCSRTTFVTITCVCLSATATDLARNYAVAAQATLESTKMLGK